jgi:predicted ATPase
MIFWSKPWNLHQLGLKNMKILQPKENNLKQLTVFVPKDYSGKVKEAMFCRSRKYRVL